MMQTGPISQHKLGNQKQLIITKCPGKVLISGGYAILQANNYGLSLALDSYFYCLHDTRANQQKITNDKIFYCEIYVSSPQIGQNWCYLVKQVPKLQNNKQLNNNRQRNRDTQGQKKIEIVQKQGKNNPFVQNAVYWSMFCLINMKKSNLPLKKSISLTLLFTRNFLSDSSISQYCQNTQYFPHYNSNAKKTGLGSSACVIVSIVDCLLKIFGHANNKQDQNSIQYRRTVNLISQIANLSAQKKIGSNFDISTAVFGSHLYKNILPHRISPILNIIQFKDIQQLIQIDPEVCLIDTHNDSKIGNKINSYIIDPNMGTDTRKMVSGFIDKLQKQSKQIQYNFFNKSKQITLQLHKQLLQILANNPQANKFTTIKQLNRAYRQVQQTYSKLTGIPIQPEEFKQLLDVISGEQNVIYVICPGSGGYDAIFVLTLGHTPVIGFNSNQSQEQHSTNQIKAEGAIKFNARQVKICFGNQCHHVSQDQRHQITKYLSKNKLQKNSQ